MLQLLFIFKINLEFKLLLTYKHFLEVIFKNMRVFQLRNKN